jgi:hypothetical protein
MKGILEIGTDESGNVVLNHPNIDQNESGGYIVFTPDEADGLAVLLLKMARRARLELLPAIDVRKTSKQ